MRAQFGDFTMDGATRQLRHRGTVVHVSPKAFDLLLALIENRPNVLTKADIHARLWPDVFVSDGNLAMLVAELRAALGEAAREPHFIRTVHRHGYAFSGTVTAPSPAPSTGATSPGAWLAQGATRWPIPYGDHLVGRDPAAHIWIDAPSISRQHARITLRDTTIVVTDLASKNGTWVGDTRVAAPTPVRAGDVIRFGAVSTVLHIWTEAPTRTEGDQ